MASVRQVTNRHPLREVDSGSRRRSNSRVNNKQGIISKRATCPWS